MRAASGIRRLLLLPAGEGFGPVAFRGRENFRPALFDQRGGGVFVLLGQVLGYHGAAVVPVAGMNGTGPALHAAEIVVTQSSVRWLIHGS